MGDRHELAVGVGPGVLDLEARVAAADLVGVVEVRFGALVLDGDVVGAAAQVELGLVLGVGLAGPGRG